LPRRDITHSRLVNFLKVALPLAALALLSSMFLFARTFQSNPTALPYAPEQIAEMLDDPHLQAPRTSTLNEKGDEVLFTARRAYPGASDSQGMRAIDPDLLILSPDGSQTRVTARQGNLDPAADEVVMRENVKVETDQGEQLLSEELHARISDGHMFSPGPARAIAPGLVIDGDSMTRTRSNGSGSDVVVFNGNVKLLYQP